MNFFESSDVSRLVLAYQETMILLNKQVSDLLRIRSITVDKDPIDRLLARVSDFVATPKLNAKTASETDSAPISLSHKVSSDATMTEFQTFTRKESIFLLCQVLSPVLESILLRGIQSLLWNISVSKHIEKMGAIVEARKNAERIAKAQFESDQETLQLQRALRKADIRFEEDTKLLKKQCEIARQKQNVVSGVTTLSKVLKKINEQSSQRETNISRVALDRRNLNVSQRSFVLRNFVATISHALDKTKLRTLRQLETAVWKSFAAKAYADSGISN
jgi:tRNA(Glu) U13 pseudouridine synthase TruD